MKLHFDPNQQFQHDAINSIVGIFEGQSLNQCDFSFSMSLEGCLFWEGGVGKTYVYPRTIYELNKKYGFKKFCRQDVYKTHGFLSDELYRNQVRTTILASTSRNLLKSNEFR